LPEIEFSHEIDRPGYPREAIEDTGLCGGPGRHHTGECENNGGGDGGNGIEPEYARQTVHAKQTNEIVQTNQQIKIVDVYSFSGTKKPAKDKVWQVEDAALKFTGEVLTGIGIGVPDRQVTFVQGGGQLAKKGICLVKIVRVYTKGSLFCEYGIEEDAAGGQKEKIGKQGYGGFVLLLKHGFLVVWKWFAMVRVRISLRLFFGYEYRLVAFPKIAKSGTIISELINIFEAIFFQGVEQVPADIVKYQSVLPAGKGVVVEPGFYQVDGGAVLDPCSRAGCLFI
jgi:hypothetical protein